VSLAAADDRDIIERLWDAVFGEKEKAPFVSVQQSQRKMNSSLIILLRD
jgi:hypothetical protein